MKVQNTIDFTQNTENNTRFSVNTEDIMLDLTIALGDIYNADLEIDGETLKIKFSNGQNFGLQIVRA